MRGVSPMQQEKAYPSEYGNDYSEDYFLANSLLLVEGYCPTGEAAWYVSDLAVHGRVLNLSLRFTQNDPGTNVCFHRIYRIEVAQKLEEMQRIRSVTTYQVIGNQQIVSQYVLDRDHPYGAREIVYDTGDVDGDGKIDAADALPVLRYAVGKGELSRLALTAADTTGEHHPDAADALCILQKAVGNIRHFPAQITPVGYGQWEISHVDAAEDFAAGPRNKNYIKTQSFSQTPRVALCQTAHELTAALAETYGVSPAGQQWMAEAFSQDYFEQKALLLVEARTPSTGTEVVLEDLYAVGTHWYADLSYWGTHSGGLTEENRIYWIELTEVPAAETVSVETDWWVVDRDGHDHILKTVTETVPIL